MNEANGMSVLSRALLLLVLALTLLLSAQLSIAGRFGNFDAIRDFCSPLPAVVWHWLTALGDERALLALFLPFSLRFRKQILPILVAALIAWLISRGLKQAFHLPRPGLFFAVDPLLKAGERTAYNSFPSNHATMTFAFVAVWIGSLGWRWVLPLLALASAVALSRVAIGAHSPADVLAGALVGCVAAQLALILLKKRDWLEAPARFSGALSVMVLAVLTLPFVDKGFPDTFPLRLVLVVWAIGGLAVSFRQFPLFVGGADQPRK